ncbi:MAG: helix-turn-helix domain-containing protein [Thermoproteaceae archaeon]|nr:helix-turn-helix domain-containing protein [Thermoproteaceae archaeon]
MGGARELTDLELTIVRLYRCGMTPREIASALGVSVRTVYSAVSRARSLGVSLDAYAELARKVNEVYEAVRSLVEELRKSRR